MVESKVEIIEGEIVEAIPEKQQMKPVEDKGNYLEKVVSENTIIELRSMKRASARRKGYAEIKVKAREIDQEYIDTITLKGSLSISAFRLLEEAEVLQNDEMDFEAISQLVDIFPKFMIKITQKATFTVSEQEFESFDDLVKVGIMEILFVHYEKVKEIVSKK